MSNEREPRLALHFTREELMLLAEGLSELDKTFVALQPTKYRKILALRATIKCMAEMPTAFY